MRPNAMATPDTAATLAALSPGGDTLALAAADSRLKTFDTGSGKLKLNLSAEANVLPNGDGPSASGHGHLTEQFTCLAWGSVSAKEGGKGKKRTAAEVALVAVGTSSGDVLAFDVGLGELRWRSKECNEGGVLSVAFCSSSGGLFFCAGEDSQVCAVDAATGTVQYQFQAGRAALNSISVTPKNEYVLVGSSGLGLWSLSDGHKCICKFTGHPSQVKALDVSPDGRFGVSCGRGERSVVMWWLEGPYKKKEAIAAGLLDTEDPVVSVSAFPGSSDGSFVALAVTDSGEVYAWECSAGKKARTGAGELLCRVRVNSSAVPGSQGIFAAKVEGSGKGQSLLVARGSDVRPSFDRVPLGSLTDKTVELQAVEDGLLLASTPAANGKKGKALRPQPEERVISGTGAGLDDSSASVLQPTIAGKDATKRKRLVDEATGMDVDGDEGATGAGAMTLGERVAALELGKRLDDDEDDKDQEAVASTSGPIKADSLGVLLLQAIRSEDSALLERCLNVSNDTVINNTIRRLPSSASLQFLKAAVARLQGRPARGALLSTWIRAVLTHHAAYLMGAPTAADTLMSLYQTVDNRLALYRPLITLSGRLSLLMAQAPAAGSDDTLEAAQPGRDGPLATLELSDDDDVDQQVVVEDPFTAGGGVSDSDEDSDDEDEEEGGSEEGWETDDELDSD